MIMNISILFEKNGNDQKYEPTNVGNNGGN
jgi:hypothetical protein